MDLRSLPLGAFVRRSQDGGALEEEEKGAYYETVYEITITFGGEVRVEARYAGMKFGSVEVGADVMLLAE